MCLILTILTAIFFTILYLSKKKRGLNAKAEFTTLLMFWSASFMWSVDGIANVIEKEPFFDISLSDTILGFIIIACGLVVYGVLNILEKRKLAMSI